MEVNLEIESKDIEFLKELLKDKKSPVHIDTVLYDLAVFKTSDIRKSKIKIYNQNAEYKVGDLIYKEFSGKLRIGTKKFIELDRIGVVLRVVDVRESNNYNEIKLAYDGTSDFKKYIDYLERNNIELMLPHKQKRPCEKAEILPPEKDPRLKERPLNDKEFNILKKKLFSAINRDKDIILTSDWLLLKDNLKVIDEEVINKIRDFLESNKKSESTEFFVENFIKIKPDSDEFTAYCFSLNYIMETEYQIDFQMTNPKGWAKWNLISVIYRTKKDSLLGIKNPLLKTYTLEDKTNLVHKRKRFEEELLQGDLNKFYLTQREIYSGGLRLRSGVFDFGDVIELEAVDKSTKKSYTVFYYKDDNILLGMKKIYENYKALQGSIINLEQIDESSFKFSFKTTKKGSVVNKVIYDEELSAFKSIEEQIASQVFVSKSMFLEYDEINKIYSSINEYRKIENLNLLIHKIFLDFGIRDRNFELHILKLYHILDYIYPIELKYVIDILISNREFIHSDKVIGVFYLDSAAVDKIVAEENKRKELIAIEERRKREEEMKKKLEEERLKQEILRKKREERRKKREEEMRLKERLKKEREMKKFNKPQKPIVSKDKKSERFEKKEDRKFVRKEHKRFEKPVRKSDRDEIKKPRPKKVFKDFKKVETVEEKVIPKKFHQKKSKKFDVDKEVKPKKKVVKTITDEKLDLNEIDIKKDLEFEKLKEKASRIKKKKAKKEVKVAYKDEGGFGGIFASKLDKIVKSEKEEEKKGKNKK